MSIASTVSCGAGIQPPSGRPFLYARWRFKGDIFMDFKLCRRIWFVFFYFSEVSLQGCYLRFNSAAPAYVNNAGGLETTKFPDAQVEQM